MNSDENKSSIFGMSFLDIQKQEKEKEKKKKQAEYAKKYYNKPEVKARNTALRQTKVHEERMAKMDQDQHVICKKLGKSIAHSRRYLDYSFKCTNCEVSYSKKDQNQWNSPEMSENVRKSQFAISPLRKTPCWGDFFKRPRDPSPHRASISDA